TVAYTYEHVPTATTLTATPATVPSGGSVTLTATVAAAGIVPGGAVAFTVAGGQPRTVPLADGTASLTVTAGTAGTQVVTAAFVGDTTFASSTSTLDLVVTPAAVKPVLTAVLPPVACTAGGTTVLLVGRNLTGTTGVTFGSTAAASFRVVSDTAVSVRVPAHAAGKAEVRVTTPGGTTKAVPFVYVAPPRGFTCPKVAAVS
ncbi:Ig-like domain repeat protein, partial [Cellulomonas algicola]